MKRIPSPPDLNDTTRTYPRDLEAAFGPYQRQSPIVPMDDEEISPPPILPFLVVCALAVLLSLLSGCSSADANEPPSAGQLYAAQEQRLAIVAAKVCGPGKTAVWTDSAEMRCHRNQ
ncbi:hypothetical protein D3C72_987670 [compost metagenome]